MLECLFTHFYTIFPQEACLVGSGCKVNCYLQRPETKGFRRVLIIYIYGSRLVIRHL